MYGCLGDKRRPTRVKITERITVIEINKGVSGLIIIFSD